MNESLEEAESELKRVDHMLHITIKYTRSSEVLKKVINQFITVFDLSTKAILKQAKKNKKIKEVPAATLLCYKLIEKLFPKESKKFIKVYKFLKKVDKSAYTVTEEYRKHLTINVKDIQIKVPDFEEYFQITKEYFKFAKAY